jgi:uncharacterized protein (TIGR03437 family)
VFCNRNWPDGRIGRGNRAIRIFVASWAILLPALAAAQTYNISLIAGTLPTAPSTAPVAGFSGDYGQASSAELSSPSAIWVDANHNIYIADKDNDRIRVISSSGVIKTIAGSSTAEVYSGDGKTADKASLYEPNGIAFDSSGNLYIADTGNHVVRKVDHSTNIISTVAGNNYSAYSGDGAAATSANLSYPSSLAFDSAGNLYIADTNNDCIRKVNSSGIISTFAGMCSYPLYQGDGGPATSAKLNKPYSIAFDAQGNLYIADTENECIRVVTTDGIINTYAGACANENASEGWVDGPASEARFYSPSGIAIDAAGSIYVADKGNCVIRKIAPGGTVATIAGNTYPTYTAGPSGLAASLYFPLGLALDSSGNVYVADSQNDLVRELTVSNASSLPSINAGGVASAYQFGALSTAAPGSWIEIYGSNLATGTEAWSANNFNGNTAPTSLLGTEVSIGGKLAYVSYVSPGQVNVQVPAGVAAGTEPVVVTSMGVSENLPVANVSAAQSIAIAATAPGLFAPSVFLIGGNQYVGALFPDFATYVLPPGEVNGIASQRAKPGDTLVLFGIGFGGGLPAGQIANSSEILPAGSFEVSFGGTPATVNYAGLAPDYVGLYQFNVVVPSVPANDLTPVTFTLGGVAGAQTLYTAIGN